MILRITLLGRFVIAIVFLFGLSHGFQDLLSLCFRFLKIFIQTWQPQLQTSSKIKKNGTFLISLKNNSLNWLQRTIKYVIRPIEDMEYFHVWNPSSPGSLVLRDAIEFYKPIHQTMTWSKYLWRRGTPPSLSFNLSSGDRSATGYPQMIFCIVADFCLLLFVLIVSQRWRPHRTYFWNVHLLLRYGLTLILSSTSILI